MQQSLLKSAKTAVYKKVFASMYVRNVSICMCQKVRACKYENMHVQCLTVNPPPPAHRTGRAAGSWTARGPTAGLSGHNLAVHGTQQQHQTHGPKHLAGTRPRDLQVEHHRRHCGEENIWQQ